MQEQSSDRIEKRRDGPVFDLEERSAKFAEAVIAFARQIPKNVITLPLIGQLVRSGTSVGANYCEADSAVLKKDFRHTISISRKEARETMY
jgi:four helix bundle protein